MHKILIEQSPYNTRAMPSSLVVVLALVQLLACKEVLSMDALDSRKYFSDAAAATLVDQVQAGDLSRVKQSLAAGVSVNALGSNGFRPIHFVFVAPTSDVLRALIAAGADPNARLSNGNTPLHFAVRMPNPDFTSVLLAAKADPNARGENDKPVVHVATAFPGNRALEQLAKAGADLNVVWAGKSPLLFAVASMTWKSAATLLSLGADPTLRDRRGESAADWWCGQLKEQPVVEKYRPDVLALADAFAARGVTLACAGEVARLR